MLVELRRFDEIYHYTSHVIPNNTSMGLGSRRIILKNQTRSANLKKVFFLFRVIYPLANDDPRITEVFNNSFNGYQWSNTADLKPQLRNTGNSKFRFVL